MESLDISDEDCHFEEGFVYAPYNNWSKLDEREKSRISTQANKEYVSIEWKSNTTLTKNAVFKYQ